MMPRGDGSGPGGQGARTGGGRGQGGAGGGRRRQFAAGPGGYCVCSQCGERIPHERGAPCYDQKCPSCGASMTRE
jgi:hypothetical protein